MSHEGPEYGARPIHGADQAKNIRGEVLPLLAGGSICDPRRMVRDVVSATAVERLPQCRRNQRNVGCRPDEIWPIDQGPCLHLEVEEWNLLLQPLSCHPAEALERRSERDGWIQVPDGE